MTIVSISFFLKKFKKINFGVWYSLPCVAILVALMVYPLFYNLVISFQGEEGFDLEGYAYISNSPRFWNSVVNTVLWTFGGFVMIISIAFVAALLLNRQFVGNRFFKVLYLLPWFTPVWVSAIIFRWIYHSEFGVLNYVIQQDILWLASPKLALFSVLLSAVWRVSPFIMLLLLAGLEKIPKNLYESAEVDGANIFQRFQHITLPHLFPVLQVTFVIICIWFFQTYTRIELMTSGGPIHSTEILSVYIYKLGFRYFRFQAGSAAATILAIVVFIFTIAYLRLLRRVGGL